LCNLSPKRLNRIAERRKNDIDSLLFAWILSKFVGKAVEKAVANVKSASELLKDFIVNIVCKAIFLVGFVVALSMLEVNIGPLLAAIGAAGFIFGFCTARHFKQFCSRHYDSDLPTI
jgi:small conductance mechanosensitive channel